VAADPDNSVFGYREERVNVDVINWSDTRKHPLDRPDIIRIAGYLGAAPCMNYDEGVDAAIAVVINKKRKLN
jgi:hypothetical protein